MKIENLQQNKKARRTIVSKTTGASRGRESGTMADHQEEQVHEHDADGDAVAPVVQLGFSVPIESAEHLEAVAHRSFDYNLWDGGQIGGLPVWLQPADIPTGPLYCLNPNCSAVMSFLCQLYAPVETESLALPNDGDKNEAGDASATYDRAFHRSLYVFGCSQCTDKTIGSIRVLRAQLPEVNPFYPLAINEDDENPDENAVQEIGWQNHQPSEWNVKQCAVCGLASKFKCPLQQLHFCGPAHQKEHKIYVYQSTDEKEYLPSVFNLSELVVEQEPDLPTTDGDSNGDGKPSTMFNTNDDGESDSDEDLEQDDLNKMTGSSQTTQDSTTMAFYQRVKDRPNSQDQCLRYNRWPNPETSKQAGTPLWIHGERQPPPPAAAGDNGDDKDSVPPPCPYCHAPRKFEFQLMPQLLHYLLQGRNDTKNKNKAYSTKDESYESIKQAVAHADLMLQQAPPEQIPPALVDAKIAAVQKMQERLVGSGSAKEIDWGVVAVYTCTASCGSTSDTTMDPVLGAYREEFAWKQPSLDA
jgi:pre-rRNA-processing protein TSR4